MAVDDLGSGRDEKFWYNLSTHQVEKGQQSPVTQLWGPFDTEIEAAHAMEKAKARNEEADAKGQEWRG
ncbi:SPOR domain-containing protein [uncultured Rothia sp.]|uniref:SPOR domain-containing protein n=1 Tax=uncultured Rothia sp. TaxID=316088 RepID=UPI0032170C79